jgi:hypothetical protein
MAIRWEQIQNLSVTESEINLLAGLTANASEINVISGYTGSAADLNDVVGLKAVFDNHVAEDFATAHPIAPNTLDGLVLADGTVTEGKLNFNVATQIELDALQTLHNDLQSDHTSLQAQVDALAAVVIPGQGDDIADSIAQTIAHIDNTTDAHDATAISYGAVESGYYLLPSNVNSGDSTIQLNAALMRFFRDTDTIRLASNVAPEADYTITAIDEDLFTIDISPNAASNYLVVEDARIWNMDEVNVQQGIDRSLKNNTDTFTGRLTMDGPEGHHLSFTTKALLESTNGLQLENDVNTVIYDIDNDGNSLSNTHSLRDYVNSFDGLITKEALSADRTWTFPDRDGWIAIGDLTFADLLRVTADTSLGELSVAPGVLDNVIGEKVRAWINMADGSDFAGSTVSVQGQLSTDGELVGIGSSYKAFIVYLTYNDDLFFWYGTPEATEQDAIDAIPPYLPTAYMKLALVTVQGDGAGGVDSSTLKIHEDLRPLLGQGMSNAHYDESLHFAAVLPQGQRCNST